MPTAIITGVTGQDGAYLAQLLLEKGYTVIGLTRGYSNKNLFGLQYLGLLDKVVIEECDLLDFSSILKVLSKYQPNEIYNLGAQSSVGLSFEQPIGTIQYNTISVLNILESIRILRLGTRFYQASSSEMYGAVTKLPINAKTPMHPLSPYAISKASAYWTVVNYRESYKIYAVNGILFNHESFLRQDNFFIKKVITTAINIKYGKSKVLEVGNIDIKRDFGYSPDYVKAMFLSLQANESGDYFICSGKSIFLRDIIYHVFDKLSLDRSSLFVNPKLFRPSEIKDLYGDNSAAKEKLGWDYEKSFFDVLDVMLEEELKNYKL